MQVTPGEVPIPQSGQPQVSQSQESTPSVAALEVFAHVESGSEAKSLHSKTIKLIEREIKLQDEQSQLLERIDKLQKEALHLADNPDELESLNTDIALLQNQLISVQSSLAEIRIDYTNPQNQFIRRGLMNLKQKPTVTLTPNQHNLILQQATHIGLKGYQNPETNRLQSLYKGQQTKHHAFVKADFSHRFLKHAIENDKPVLGVTTPQEQEGLCRIDQHRHNHLEYEKMFPSQSELGTAAGNSKIEEVVNRIISDIDLLDTKSPSSRIVTLEDGTRCFTIPGGWGGEGGEGHYITYEIRLLKDKSYEFIIYNRGEKSGIKALDERLHGTFTYKDKGKTYGRTRVQIKAPKEALQDRKFVASLVSAFPKSDSTGADVYKLICSHFLDPAEGEIKPKGEVIVSSMEKYAEKLKALLDLPFLDDTHRFKIKELLKTVQQALADDPNISSLQMFETCTESSLTSVEKFMAPASTVRGLKQFSSACLTNQLSILSSESWVSQFPNTATCLDSLTAQLPPTHQAVQDLGKIKEAIEKHKKLKEELIEQQDILRDSSKVEAIKISNKQQHQKTSEEIEKMKKELCEEIDAIKKSLESIFDDEEPREILGRELDDLKDAIESAHSWAMYGGSRNHEFMMTKVLSASFKEFSMKDKDLISRLNKLGDPAKRLGELMEKRERLEREIRNPESGIKRIKNQMHEAENDINNLIRNIMKNKIPENLESQFQELVHHIVREFGHAKELNIHMGKRVEQLQRKLEAPPEKPKPEITVAQLGETYQGIVQKICEDSVGNLKEKIEKDKTITEKEFIFQAQCQIERFQKVIGEINQKCSGEQRLELTKALMNLCKETQIYIEQKRQEFEKKGLPRDIDPSVYKEIAKSFEAIEKSLSATPG